MSLDLPLLRKRLVDRESFTWTGPAPIPSMCAFILFDSEAREIVERLERAERVEAAARVCLDQAFVGNAARAALRAALAPAPEDGDGR